MKLFRPKKAQWFALVIGLTDGILTSLTLAAGHLFHGQPPTIDLSLRVAVGSAICGAFVFVTAEYSRLRGELLHAERQLNLASHGVFATAHLGKQIWMESLIAAFLSSAATFVGAFLPLLLGAFVSESRLAVFAPPILALGLLGLALARAIRGSYLWWPASLIAAGLVLSCVGVLLHIA
jgi:VIT1/CCC1 family predicted Fe2+/Mn2+ transporter